jgi:hypothetical protein
VFSASLTRRIRVPDPTYEERYCAYVDILGFRDFIAEIRKDPGRVSVVRTVLYDLKRQPEQNYLGAAIAADLRVQAISDAICISAACRGAGLVHILHSAETLAFRLLSAGYLTRGAIVKGLLYHDREVVFGEGLVKAYALEQSIVRFPRIMLTREVTLDVEANASHEVFGPHLKESYVQSTDGPYHLNILRKVDELIPDEDEEYPDTEFRAALLSTLNEIADMFQKRFRESTDTPSHFDKVRWFANYWNESVAQHPALRRVFGAGLDMPLVPDNRVVLD